MYVRDVRPVSWLVVVEKVTFIKELTDTVKDQFLKNFRTSGLERDWSVVIYYLLRIFLCTGIMLPFFHSSRKTPCWSQFVYIIDWGLVIVNLHNFTILIEIPSWPWALRRFKPLINFEIFLQSTSKARSLFWV